jgi:murein L,D-transpeptidase YcbB/YkuD
VGHALHTTGRMAALILGASAMLCACRSGPASAPQRHEPDLRDAIRAIASVKAPPSYVRRTATGRRLWTSTREFYQKHGFQPVWFDDASPGHRADELVDRLQHADRDGLDAARYAAGDVVRLRDAMRQTDRVKDLAAAAGFDVRLTYLYLQYANDLANGTTESRASRWNMHRAPRDVVASLEDAVARDCVQEALDAIAPPHPEYQRLRAALEKYREIAARGGWQPVPAALRLKPGDQNAATSALARRLAVTGDYTGAPGDNHTYGPDLQNAVKHFERRHGLEADGIVGKAVVAALNVPAAARIAQIELNMERARWLPDDLGARYVFVNVPEYRLEVRDHDRTPLAMRVVVGRKKSPTPAFSAAMTYLVFAPFWNVPANIAENETLPSALKDPEFLERTNMEVIDKRGRRVDPDDVDLSDLSEYRFRQRPGASNSLGLVKFMFPNAYNVYLHDTPADALFTRDARAFSHGCVRVEQPEKLAEYVLGDQPEWTPDRISDAMHASQHTIVRLREKIPVYITYFTARVSASGEVMFFRDVYGRDR